MNAELRLIVECCRCNFAAAPRLLERLPAEVDWVLVQRLVRFHRVQALAWNALEPLADGIPPAIAEGLAADARAQLAANLQIALECHRLDQRFRSAAVPLLFVKGLTLGALVYSNALLKSGWDIDVLVPSDRLADAADLLRAQAYELVLPAKEPQLGPWHATHKESVWRKGEPEIHIELHTGLVDNPAMLTAVGIESAIQDVQVLPGVALPTLETDELFAYLCVHGASSAWFRLKWIADVAALLEGKDAEAILALYRRSQQLGAARAAGQALLLADTLFGTLNQTTLRKELERDRGTEWLASAALAQLTRSAEPTERALGTWRIHLTQLLLKPGIGFKARELARQLRDAFG